MPKPELLKYIWRLSIPVLLTNLLQTSVTVIDTYMVGRLGPLAIAAVGMGNTLRLMLLIAVLSVSGGAMSLIAQAKGARDETRMSLVTRQGIVSGLLLSVFLAVLGFAVAPWLLSAMENGGQEGVIELSYQYLTIIFIGTPFLTLNIIMDRLMQGAGDTFTPFAPDHRYCGTECALQLLLYFRLVDRPRLRVSRGRYWNGGSKSNCGDHWFRYLLFRTECD